MHFSNIDLNVSTQTMIARIEDQRDPGHQPEASVVIVAYNSNQDLIRCLESLQGQTYQKFEVILVDNGGNEAVLGEIRYFQLCYIRMKHNYQPSQARNVGIMHSHGQVVCFLDDDALADPDFINNHVQACQQPGVLGARGKVLPKTNTPFNKLAMQYDLGNKIIPSYIELEGNASFHWKILIEVGGFNPSIFAGEGAELSYRIVKRYGNPKSLIYWPGAVIYHDFATGFHKYLRKTWRGAKMHVVLDRLYPDFWEFVEYYHPFPHGETIRQRTILERAQVAFLRRSGNFIRRLGLIWFRQRLPSTE